MTWLRVSEWILTEGSLREIPCALDPDKERAVERYEALRLTLVKFFDLAGHTSLKNAPTRPSIASPERSIRAKRSETSRAIVTARE